jgi:hypothetical protein
MVWIWQYDKRTDDYEIILNCVRKLTKNKSEKRLGDTGRGWERLGEAGRGWERLGEAGRGWERLGEAGRGWERLF